MKSIPRADIYFDKRYKTVDNKFPVKLKVSYCRVSKFYKTGIKLTKEAFEKSYGLKSPQGLAYQQKTEISAYLHQANEIIKKLTPFSFGEFESQFYNTAHQVQGDLFKYFEKVISYLTINNQVSTSILYKNALDKLKSFVGKESLSFDGFSTEKLFKFHEWMENDLSTSTISMYQRCIKAVYNRAIADQLIASQISPYSKENKIKKYTIPSATNKKKTLTAENVKKILEYCPIKGSVMERAKDYWLMSLYANGLNMADLLSLRNKHYTDETISFVRKKTKSTSKKETKIEISVIDEMAKLISKYRNNDLRPESLLFPIIVNKDNPFSVRKAIKNFTNSVNKQMKILAKDIGITGKISTYYARYTFSNLAKNKNVSTEYIKEALGHANIKTTEIYLDSFNENIRIENTNKIFEDLTI